MNLIRLTVIVLSTILITPALQAQESEVYTGNKLLADCQGDQQNNWVASGICLGYIDGFWHGWNTALELHRILVKTTAVKQYCMPSESTSGQRKAIVIKYLKDNPTELHLGANILVMQALSVFVCANNTVENDGIRN